jgi:signal transduction histidine kinase
VDIHVDVPRRCPPAVEATAYFVVSEALTNVTRHARARQAAVTVVRAGDRLRVTVTDDGRGGAVAAPGGGLHGLAQRAASVDGTLHLHSPPGGPTEITVELPCGS